MYRVIHAAGPTKIELKSTISMLYTLPFIIDMKGLTQIMKTHVCPLNFHQACTKCFPPLPNPPFRHPLHNVTVTIKVNQTKEEMWNIPEDKLYISERRLDQQYIVSTNTFTTTIEDESFPGHKQNIKNCRTRCILYHRKKTQDEH